MSQAWDRKLGPSVSLTLKKKKKKGQFSLLLGFPFFSFIFFLFKILGFIYHKKVENTNILEVVLLK